ncbi:TetR/AcrR family transcriptional regulator [Spongiactinospora sp. TRM90649]|uniref:TetR/AcrR family transcriptional regulator n=1 Tax=Spongiactinospora sp. TRM90649 TaxID=3031114 RepID=UPI0023F90FA0|nr:TetR/AcrR family transcriptional regulator [Spongiactinospora sp. TRM90649]MDF5757560.1 TetR/AcrR family transcriptional regulator [Spongiactinospora sp. TRM90649]
MRDGRLLRGERTRQAVLDSAVAMASVDGLDGLSLAGLAKTLGVSKSGLFAHWPDKETLQLAIIGHARRQWEDRIVRPALRHPRGVRRLWALHDNRIRFYQDGVLPGGCFFGSAEGEFADQPGAVQDAIATAKHDWMSLLTGLAARAVGTGELRAADADPGQLAFEIEALGAAVIRHTHLLTVEQTYDYARRAVLARLRSLATDPTILPEDVN